MDMTIMNQSYERLRSSEILGIVRQTIDSSTDHSTRLEFLIDYLQKLKQDHIDSMSIECHLNDILYGVGLFFDSDRFSYEGGYMLWLEVLKIYSEKSTENPGLEPPLAECIELAEASANLRRTFE